MKNGFSAMNVILRRAKYKLMTSSDASEFAKTESYYIYYYIILTDRNENGFNHTSAYISLTLSRRLDHPAPEKTFKVSTVTIFGSDTRSDIGYVH